MASEDLYQLTGEKISRMEVYFKTMSTLRHLTIQKLNKPTISLNNNPNLHTHTHPIHI